MKYTWKLYNISQILDIRNPNKNRSVFSKIPYYKKYTLLVILNKCDLVPKWVVKFWMKYFAKHFPVLAISNTKHRVYGNKTILSLIKNFFSKSIKIKIKKIYVLGEKGSGKTTVINSLKLVKHKMRLQNNNKNFYSILKNVYIIEICTKIGQEIRKKYIHKLYNSKKILIKNYCFIKNNIQNLKLLKNSNNYYNLATYYLRSILTKNKLPFYILPFKY